MKVYTNIVSLVEREDSRIEHFEPVIFDTDDIIDISCFGYGMVTVLLKNGQNYICSSVVFASEWPLYYDRENAREIKCESYDFYEKLKR